MSRDCNDPVENVITQCGVLHKQGIITLDFAIERVRQIIDEERASRSQVFDALQSAMEASLAPGKPRLSPALLSAVQARFC